MISRDCPLQTLLIKFGMPNVAGQLAADCKKPNPEPSFWMVDPNGPVVRYLTTTPGASPCCGRVTFTTTGLPFWSQVRYDLTALNGVRGNSLALDITALYAHSGVASLSVPSGVAGRTMRRGPRVCL